MKYLCFALVILLLFSLVACTNAGDRGAGDVYPNDTSGTGSITGEDSYFFEERTATGINLDKIFSFEKNGDEVTLIGLSFDRTLDNISVKAFSMDLDGRIVDENTLNTGGRVPSTAGVAPTGMVWLLFVDWEHDDDDKISLEGVNLEAYDNSGNHVKSVVLDLPGISDDDLTPEVYLIIGEDGYFYVCFEGLIMQGFSGVFDENGTLLFDFTESDERKTRSIAKMPDGRVSALQMVMTMENAGASPVIKIIDADNKKYAAEVLYLSFGSSNWWEVFFANGYDGYDLLRCEKTVIYGVCHETGDLEVLAKYDVNYTFQDIHKFAVISSGNILKLDHSTTLGITVMKYTKTDAPIHTDKTKLVLGVFFSNDMISRTVSDFNKLSPKYEIEIKEYMGQRGVDFIGALDAYNLDLITGNIPDITAIHIIASMPLRSYFDKGVFADLYEFFDADPDINREDYVDSVLKALETDGKLYTMAPSFEIDTLIGKKSVVGADMGWTWDEFFALLDKNPEAMPISLSRQS
ncbi:MAG: extracellular solute-binding protein, partial [Oscillospiraceae bacterium]|nr:extracellular solute-binding protein [Oscillospiraceae bacterium]